MTRSPRTLVVIPALNEEAALPLVLEELAHHAPECDVLVIDDGSTDDTANVARACGARVVSLPFNMGVGTALRTGFRFAVRNGYDRVVQTDADGQHDAREIHRLVAALDDGADLVIGSRFVARDGHYQVERSRGAAMGILRGFTVVLLGRRIHDSTSGFRGFSAPLTKAFSRTYPREFLSDTVEALLMASYGGFRVDEVPVRMRTRAGGEPSHRSLRLYYHYLRLLVVMTLTASLDARRVLRREAAR
ncbi:MAG: glycosyltransferase family 2 protein [Thermoleophilia bacterium]|nr:glycosyltransferase family 2 protein [Thermoleophilia bacterium]